MDYSSLTVATMVGRRHGHLLQDIDGHVAILSKGTDPKIGVSDFFVESSYRDIDGYVTILSQTPTLGPD